MIVKDHTITYQEVFNKLCELNERSENSDYKFNWISKAEFNNIIKQLDNSVKIDHVDNVSIVSVESNGYNGFSEITEQVIDVYAID